MAKRKSKKKGYNVADTFVIVGALVLIGLTAASLDDLTGFATVTNYAAPKLVLSPNPVLAGQTVTATIGGFKNVEEKTVYLRQGGCGEGNYIYAKGDCPDGACNIVLAFNAPKANMVFPIYACVETGITPVGTATISSAMVNLDVMDAPDLVVGELSLAVGDSINNLVPASGEVSLSQYGGKLIIQPELIIENAGTRTAGEFDISYYACSVPDKSKTCPIASEEATTSALQGDVLGLARPTLKRYTLLAGKQMVLDKGARDIFPAQAINKVGIYKFKVYVDEPSVNRDVLTRGDSGIVNEFSEDNNEAEVTLVVTN